MVHASWLRRVALARAAGGCILACLVASFVGGASGGRLWEAIGLETYGAPLHSTALSCVAAAVYLLLAGAVGFAVVRCWRQAWARGAGVALIAVGVIVPLAAMWWAYLHEGGPLSESLDYLASGLWTGDLWIVAGGLIAWQGEAPEVVARSIAGRVLVLTGLAISLCLPATTLVWLCVTAVATALR
jgi:hypothetical protein